MTYKTTKSDFKKFDAAVCKWKKYFGLLDWEIITLHSKLKNARADYWANIPAKLATISLNTRLDFSPMKKEIEKCAFHEVCEVMLCQLRALGGDANNYDIVDEQIHYVIRILENTVFK